MLADETGKNTYKAHSNAHAKPITKLTRLGKILTLDFFGSSCGSTKAGSTVCPKSVTPAYPRGVPIHRRVRGNKEICTFACNSRCHARHRPNKAPNKWDDALPRICMHALWGGCPLVGLASALHLLLPPELDASSPTTIGWSKMAPQSSTLSALLCFAECGEVGFSASMPSTLLGLASCSCCEGVAVPACASACDVLRVCADVRASSSFAHPLLRAPNCASILAIPSTTVPSVSSTPATFFSSKPSSFSASVY